MDQITPFCGQVDKYLQNMGYDEPLGMRVIPAMLDKCIAMGSIGSTWWDKGTERVTLLIMPGIGNTYLVSFKYKDSGVNPRFRK